VTHAAALEPADRLLRFTLSAPADASYGMKILLAILASVFLLAPLQAGELATGSMLGPRYKSERFYIRKGRSWVETYSSGPYRGQARGKLMMVRLAQGVFDDERLDETSFDPEANTASLIAALDEYKRHGVLAVSVGLQGADPGYAQAVNGVQRSAAAADGPAGALISAYEADGSLKPEWMARLGRLLDAADDRGMFVCVIYFSPNQDEALESARAIVDAARNVTRWLIDNNHRNVIIDVADGWDLQRDAWDHSRFIPRKIAALAVEIRDQFNGAAFSLPIGASTAETMSYPISLARVCDLVMVRDSRSSLAEKTGAARRMSEYDRAVWVTGDTSLSSPGTGGLEPLLQQSAGWSYTAPNAEQFPFRFDPDGDALQGIAEITLKKPPSGMD